MNLQLRSLEERELGPPLAALAMSWYRETVQGMIIVARPLLTRFKEGADSVPLTPVPPCKHQTAVFPGGEDKDSGEDSVLCSLRGHRTRAMPAREELTWPEFIVLCSGFWHSSSSLNAFTVMASLARNPSLDSVCTQLLRAPNAEH